MLKMSHNLSVTLEEQHPDKDVCQSLKSSGNKAAKRRGGGAFHLAQ